MKIAAKPAVSSSDAGISASSSRLRALTRQLPALERDQEILGVVLRAKLVIGERLAPGLGDLLQRDARARVALVEADARPAARTGRRGRS